MSVVHGRGAARRLTAAALVSGLIAAGTIAGASAASADDARQSATIVGLKASDMAILNSQFGKGMVDAGLFEMAVDGGGTLTTYCIDIGNPTKDGAQYQEKPWDQTSLGSNKDAGKILWILQHSYPQVDDLASLAKEAGTGPLSANTAAAGTQVAIWRYSDKADVEAADPAAEQLADWLEKSAQDVPEPKASLSLEPNTVSGRPGSRLGPITVRTDSAAQVTVTGPADSNVRITDAKGHRVTSAVNGTKLFFDVPRGAADGTASLSTQVTTTSPVGLAFASSSRSQTQILAGSNKLTVSATASATWAKRGPVPTVTAREDCAKGGVDITVGNKGDESFTFEAAGQKHTVSAGGKKTVTIPVAEDHAYDVTITGPGGFSKNFKGVLDCKTAGPTAPGGSGSHLAETGQSSATPVLAGISIALIVIGGGAVFLLRRRKTSGER
ncbi:Cys-Gln thioester bond-forming surface protein [Streptomyces sp. NPDC005728]|uniref:Cys-Gln thioester bond-forming surface protein n=1 Tax=Streptomyces sp. NPDC005728 TaxID=3157054 RepID=UPI0034104E15